MVHNKLGPLDYGKNQNQDYFGDFNIEITIIQAIIFEFENRTHFSAKKHFVTEHLEISP